MTVFPKNIAVIGCGYWGQNIVRSAHELGVLAAVADSDPARAQQFAKTYDVPAPDFEAILADKTVTGVIFAVPAPLHAGMALQALEAGKHVMVEKPIALTLEDARRMADAAARAGRILMVGHVLQYHPAFMHLKQLVRDGKLGKIRQIYSNRLNFGKVRTEEDVFWSFAPHDVSMILALAGREPRHIGFTGVKSLPGSALASSAIATFDFGDGLSGHIHVSWLNPFKEQKLVVIGDDGMAVFDDTLEWGRKLAVYSCHVTFADGQPVLNKGDVTYPVIAQAQPLAQEISHFAACMQTGATPQTDGAEGLRVLKVMQACDALAHSNARAA